VLAIVVATALLVTRGVGGVQGIVVHPDCPMTPCGLPLQAEIRVSNAVPRPDGTVYLGSLLVARQSGADGRFQVGLPPGKYFVEAYAARGGGSYWESVPPLLVTINPFSFQEIKLTVRAFPFCDACSR
jgi:hypothetical protein